MYLLLLRKSQTSEEVSAAFRRLVVDLMLGSQVRSEGRGQQTWSPDVQEVFFFVHNGPQWGGMEPELPQSQHTCHWRVPPVLHLSHPQAHQGRTPRHT